jgi:hypothetical protein
MLQQSSLDLLQELLNTLLLGFVFLQRVIFKLADAKSFGYHKNSFL